MKKTTFIVFFVYTVVILLGSFLLKGFAFFPTAVNLLTGLVMIGVVFYLMPGSFRVGSFKKDDEKLQEVLEKNHERKRTMSWEEVAIALYVMVPWIIAALLFG